MNRVMPAPIALIPALAFLSVNAPAMSDLSRTAVEGGAVDLVHFGTPLADDGAVGVEWDNPRDVHEVRVAFVEAGGTQPLESLKLEWWGSIWPANGTGGWMRLDDPWNGRWVRVAANAVAGETPGTFVFRLPPLTKQEFKNALDVNAYPGKREPAYRRTLKVRVLRDGGALPKGTRLTVLSDSRWREASLDIDVRFTQDGRRAGRIEATNGELLGVESLPAPRRATVQGGAWSAQGVAGQSAGVRIRILYAHNKRDARSNELTRVTVRLGEAADATGFSFAPQDVLGEGSMRLPDFGVLVAETSRGLTWANDAGPAGTRWPKSVRRRVAERPEATRQSAMAGIPRLWPLRAVQLGVPSARQEVVITPSGDWTMSHESLSTAARDSERIPFRKAKGKLDAILDTRAEPRFDGGDRETLLRYLEDDRFPLMHVEWRTGPIEYHQEMTATILLGDIGDDDTRRGDETVVLLTKLAVHNASASPQTATVNLRYNHDAPLKLLPNGVVAIDAGEGRVPPGLTAIRGQVLTGTDEGMVPEGWSLRPAAGKDTSAVLRWTASLAPNEEWVLYFKSPYVDLLDVEEMARFAAMKPEDELPKVLDYWKKRFENEETMAIDVPDAALNSFYWTNLWHVLITTDRDPKTGLYNQGVGTFGYRVFANETVMVARSMDMRGEHKEAERFLEPMLHYQGSVPLKGRYSTKEGVFHGAGEYTHGEYAMNHGFVLWGVADHYFMARDRAYLNRVAPQLIKGCDFLVQERKATMTPEGKPRLPIHGLSPASSLEDVVEYQYWFATNGFFHLGMKRVAQALADVQHPEAARIAGEAEAYRRDIEIAVREAATKAAAVRLRDGSFIPYVPSRVFQWQHLTEGWIREALYPAMDLAVTEVVAPADPITTWMLDELEDNTFFSAESGYGVSDVDKNWFELGAVTLQPCLVDTPYLYMLRDEIPAALRSLWNTYALSIYPDVHCFAEWATAFGRGGGPVYKTSDESRFVMWLRQFLVCEVGNTLWLGRAVPRSWLADGQAVRVERAPTFFGPVSLLIESFADHGQIRAEVVLPTRKPPGEVWLRLRHPAGRTPARVFINGKPVGGDGIVGEDIRIVPGDVDAKRPVTVTAEYGG